MNGPSGVAYLALDALLNGNGYGIDYVNGELEDPSKPYQPDPDKPDYNPYVIPPWGVSSVSFFFEAGAGSGVQYLLTQPFGDPASPLYNPDIAGLIYQVFQGSFNVTIATVTVLDTISKLALRTFPFWAPISTAASRRPLASIPRTSSSATGATLRVCRVYCVIRSTWS